MKVKHLKNEIELKLNINQHKPFIKTYAFSDLKYYVFQSNYHKLKYIM